MAVTFLYTGVAALLSALGMLTPYTWPLSIIGIALFVRILYALPDASERHASVLGYVFGVLYTAVALIWFWHVLPLDWLHVRLVSGIVFTAGSWLIVSFSLGLAYGALAFLFIKLQRRTWFDAILFTTLWVLAEYLQPWIFSLLTWNTETLIGPHFSAAYIGYVLTATPLLMLASWGGVYLMSAATALCGFLLYTMANTRTNIRGACIRVLLVGVALGLGYGVLPLPFFGAHREPEQRITIALLATRFTQNIPLSSAQAEERTSAIRDYVREWAQTHEAPDIFVFPEGGRGSELSDADAHSFAHAVFNGATRIIDSGIVLDSDTFRERAFVREKNGEVIHTYDKLFLVPQGEYTPWLAEQALFFTGASSLKDGIRRAGRSYTRGSSLSVTKVDGINIGLLFCSDVLSPALYRTLTKNGADILINASSLAALHGSALADHIFLTMARVRAAENGRFLSIASFQTPASAITHTGEVLVRSDTSGEISVLSYEVPLITKETPYTTYGAWIVLLSACIVGARMLLFLLYKRN